MASPSQATIESLASQLEAEFCPPIDSSLLLALLSDIPTNPTQQDEQNIRETLASIAAQVEIEQLSVQLSLDDGTARDGVSSLETGSASAGGEETDETSLLSEVEAALEGWKLEDDAWERSRFAGSTPSDSPPSMASPSQPSPFASPPAQQTSTNDPFAFLASMFTKVPFATFERKLNTGIPLSAIVEELLTEELLANEALNPQSSPTPSSSGASSPAPFIKVQPRKSKNTAFTVSLTDVLQRPPTPALNDRPAKGKKGSSPRPSRSRDSSPARSAWSSASSSTNHWAELDSRSAHLAQLCHVKPARVASLLHTSGASPAKALTTLLNQLRQERASAATSSSSLAQLQAILPGVSIDSMQVLLAATEGDLSDALDLDRFIGETELDEVGGAPLVKVEMIREKSQKGSALYQHPQKYVPGLPGSGSSSGGGAQRSAIIASARREEVSGAFDENKYSSEDCRAIAVEYLEKRNEAYRTAARQYSKGATSSERSAAMTTADIGREHDARMRLWDARAARALVRERRVHAKDTIDLHNLTVHHALSVVKDSTNTWWANSPASITPAPLRIVTGAGRHSKGHAVLLPAVVKLLDREGWRWKYDTKGHSTLSGPGAVLVLGVK